MSEPPTTRRYEFSPHSGDTESRERALARVAADIAAASRLNVPFTVTTVHSKQFRHGGNVVKADVREYVIEFGCPTVLEG